MKSGRDEAAEDQSQGVCHDRTESTGNRSQLPVTPWFASRRRWRSARSLENFRDFRRPALADSIEPAYYSTALIRRTRVTLVPSAGRFVVVLVIPNLVCRQPSIDRLTSGSHIRERER